jgi:hypothetical protein
MDNKEEMIAVSASVGRNTVAVIDAMVTRGAIKGEELTTIGQLRDACLRLVALAEAAEADELPDS